MLHTSTSTRLFFFFLRKRNFKISLWKHIRSESKMDRSGTNNSNNYQLMRNYYVQVSLIGLCVWTHQVSPNSVDGNFFLKRTWRHPAVTSLTQRHMVSEQSSRALNPDNLAPAHFLVSPASDSPTWASSAGRQGRFLHLLYSTGGGWVLMHYIQIDLAHGHSQGTNVSATLPRGVSIICIKTPSVPAAALSKESYEITQTCCYPHDLYWKGWGGAWAGRGKV